MKPLWYYISQLLRWLLFPFSLLYGVITSIRNIFYNRGVLSEIEFDIPTIAVGNLSVGGTGKTPHVEYLIRLLEAEYYLATLSRGYNRDTKGFLLATDTDTALSIGDEPMQFLKKFPDIAVSVGEDRTLAVPQLLMDAPQTEVVLLDDAFQHRAIKPGINIMITEFNRLFTRDHIIPFGRLRESRKGYKRADCIIVSKCPPNLSVVEKNKLIGEIKPVDGQRVYFTSIQYEKAYHYLTGEIEHLLPDTGVILACGIGNPVPLLRELKTRVKELKLLRFRDHHYYTKGDLEMMQDALQQLNTNYKIILTTEKDAVRFDLLRREIDQMGLPLVIIPVAIHFLFKDKERFDRYVIDYVEEARAERFNS